MNGITKWLRTRIASAKHGKVSTRIACHLVNKVDKLVAENAELTRQLAKADQMMARIASLRGANEPLD